MSLGSFNQWDFELAVLRDTPCSVHTFDCTVRLAPPAGYEGRLFPHETCIGPRDEVDSQGRQFLTWGTITGQLNLTQRPDYLKMVRPFSPLPL